MQYHLEACWTSRHFLNAGHRFLSVKTTQILVCYNIDVLQSTLLINLFPPLDDERVALQLKGIKYIVYPNCIQFWGSASRNVLINDQWATLFCRVHVSLAWSMVRRLWVNVPRKGQEGFSWRWPGPPDSEFCSCASDSDWRLTQVYDQQM